MDNKKKEKSKKILRLKFNALNTQGIKEFNKKTKEITKDFSRLFVKISEAYKQSKEDAEILAEEGWFLVGWQTFAETNELANILRTKGSESLNSKIISIYEPDNWKFLEDSLNKICSYSDFSSMSEIIMDCLWAHRKEKYLLSIIAGLTVIESMIAYTTANLYEQNTNAKKQWENTFKGKYDVDTLLYNSFNSFLKKLYGWSDFEREEPAFINRHWIMHRIIRIMPSFGTKINSLRVLLAIIFIGEVSERKKRRAIKDECKKK